MEQKSLKYILSLTALIDRRISVKTDIIISSHSSVIILLVWVKLTSIIPKILYPSQYLFVQVQYVSAITM